MSDTTIATALEPAPVNNGGIPVWPLVIRDILADFSACESIVEDCKARDAWGRAKYGTPLRTNNGRDALVDAYQEALDLAVYLRQAIAEGCLGADVCGQYNAALRLAVDLRRAIAKRDKARSSAGEGGAEP